MSNFIDRCERNWQNPVRQENV